MDPAKMKVVNLGSELAAFGLDTKGNKPALVDRIKKELESKTGKVLPDTSILDTSNEDIDDGAISRKAERRIKRQSSSSSTRTPAKQSRFDKPPAPGKEEPEEVSESAPQQVPDLKPPAPDVTSETSRSSTSQSPVPVHDYQESERPAEFTEEEVYKGLVLDKRIKTVIRRSRSRTPSPSSLQGPSLARRKQIFQNLQQKDLEWPSSNILGFGVRRTPAKSMRLQRSVGVVETPSGRFHRSSCPDTSSSSAQVSHPNPAVVEQFFARLEEAGMDEEELELEVELNKQPEHLLRWLRDLPSPMTVREGNPIPIRVSDQPTPRNVAAEIASEEVSPSCSFQPEQSEATRTIDVPLIVTQASGSDLVAQEEFYRDPQPSVSGQNPQPSALPSRFVYKGSDCDSEYDDEWDEDMAPEPNYSRDIPDDDDLDEHLRNKISALETNMEDAHDRLLEMNVDFDWESSFDTFRGAPEAFSGPTPGPVDDYATPYDAFVAIWDESIMGHIAVETNRYARQTIDEKTENGTLGHHSRLRRWVETSVSELYVLFGLFITMGIDQRASLKEYWSSNKYLDMHGFKDIMTYSRYILLNKFLHFVDNSTLEPLPAARSGLQQTGDGLDLRLQKLQPIIDWLNEKFASLYNLLPDISIDESLLLYKGRLSWLQAIRTKAARLGMKSFEICEALTGYLYKIIIYTGSTVSAPTTDADTLADATDLGGKTTKVVQKLMDGLWNRGHCLTMDNFYNSPALARYLKLRGTDCLGTLRVNRRHVPASVRLAPNVPWGSMVSLHSGDVSITSWKDAKPVTLISTFHDNSTYMGTRGGRPCRKPTVMRDYNTRMGGIDSKDQKLSYYLIERKRGLKWYIKMFKRLFNASVHNAWIMYNTSRRRRDLPIIAHRRFRYELLEALIDGHQVRQTKPPCIAPDTRLNREVIHVPMINSGKGCVRGRCVFCYRNGIRKVVPSKCVSCGVFLCFEPCWEPYHALKTLPERK